MVKSKANLKETVITMRSLMELVYCLLSTDWKKKPSNWRLSYRQVILATGKVISLPITAQFLTKSNFSDTLLESLKNFPVIKK